MFREVRPLVIVHAPPHPALIPAPDLFATQAKYGLGAFHGGCPAAAPPASESGSETRQRVTRRRAMPARPPTASAPGGRWLPDGGRGWPLGLGADGDSWAVDGAAARHAGAAAPFGAAWRAGDVIGLACDLVSEPGRLLVAVNGSWAPPHGLAATLPAGAAPRALYPAVTGGTCEVRANLGERPWRFGPPPRQDGAGGAFDSFVQLAMRGCVARDVPAAARMREILLVSVVKRYRPGPCSTSRCPPRVPVGRGLGSKPVLSLARALFSHTFPPAFPSLALSVA